MSCSSDEQELAEGGKAIVYGHIITRADNGNTYVGADGDKEIINNWWVVFVNQNNNIIEKIVTRDENKTTAVEQECFRVDLAGGTYEVYTFANISKSTVESLLTGTIKTITEGQQMPNLSKVKIDINDITKGGIANGTLVSKNGIAIPSSSKIESDFDPGSQSVDFEVIRMVAKFDFVFKNMSGKDITLRSLKLLPVQEGEILLIPDETVADKEKETDPEILDGENDKVYTKDLTFDFTNTKVYANPIKLPANVPADNWKKSANWYKHSFYVRESSASSHPTKHFRIELSISGRDGKTSESLYTITDKVGGQPFTGFNRNDYIQIPIVFTDYKVELMADSYAPIGGYPTEISENKPNEFYCKFAHQGEFIIMPYLYDASTGNLVYYPECDYEIVEKSAGVPDIEDPDKIFVDPTLGADVQGKLPTKNAVTGEITGKLNTNEGTASVYIHIWVWTDTGHTVKQDFYRRIYIIRKNP